MVLMRIIADITCRFNASCCQILIWNVIQELERHCPLPGGPRQAIDLGFIDLDEDEGPGAAIGMFGLSGLDNPNIPT